MTKDAAIAEILGNSAYQPSSGVYQGAKKALESLSSNAVGQIWAVVVCKREEVAKPNKARG